MHERHALRRACGWPGTRTLSVPVDVRTEPRAEERKETPPSRDLRFAFAAGALDLLGAA